MAGEGTHLQALRQVSLVIQLSVYGKIDKIFTWVDIIQMKERLQCLVSAIALIYAIFPGFNYPANFLCIKA